MKFIKHWRRKNRNQVPIEVGSGSPDDVFLFHIGRLAVARDPMLIDISGYRRVMPKEPIGSWAARFWWRGYFAPDDVVQITPDASPNFGGCCLIVTDCGEKNVYGYVLAPSRDGRVGIDMCLPVCDVRKIGRTAWRSSRIRLSGAKE